MLKYIKSNYYFMGAAFTMGVLNASDAHAAGAGLNQVFQSVTTGMQDFPRMMGVVSYLFGTMFTVLGIMKVKQHVESPQQNELKDGAIRLIAGGALFALPTLMNAAQTMFGTTAAVQTNQAQVVLR